MAPDARTRGWSKAELRDSERPRTIAGPEKDQSLPRPRSAFFSLRSRFLSPACEDQLERFSGRRTRAIRFRTVVLHLAKRSISCCWKPAAILHKYSSASLNNVTFISSHEYHESRDTEIRDGSHSDEGSL